MLTTLCSAVLQAQTSPQPAGAAATPATTAAPASSASTSTSTSNPGAAELEEVVVTSQRRAERLQDVPISVSAFSQEKLDSQGLRSIDDVTQLTPGVTFERNGLSAASNYNDENSDISIRGIQSSAGTSTTGLYIDDTPIQTRHIGFGTVNPFPVLFDLERVELLRGPQGTLFGAGSEGGTVRFVTPDPSLTTFSGYDRGELASTYTGDTSYEAGAAAGGPIVADVLGFRASAYYRRDGGYVDRENYMTGQITEPNSNWQNTANARLALKWAVNDKVSITPSLYYQRLYLNDTAAVWPELSNIQEGVFRNGNRQTNSSTDPFYLAAIKLDWDLGSAHLTADTSYFSRRQHSLPDYTQFDRAVYGLDPRAPLGAAGESPFEDNQDNTVMEVRLQSTNPDARISWTTGLFFTHLDENETQDIIDPTLNAEYTAAYGVPLCTAAAPCPGGQIATQPEFRLVDRQYAAYGEANFKLTRAWSVTTGLRVARTEFTGDTIQYGPFVGATVGANNALIANGSGAATPVTPRFVLNYQPDRDSLYYASAAKGYRVGGINQGLGSLCDSSLATLGLTKGPNTYSADSLWSYELGAKNTLLDRRLQINSSLFVIDWKGIQQNVYLLACGLQFVQNLGQVRSEGGDIDVQMRPVDPLFIELTAAYTEARYTSTICGGPIVCTGPNATGAPIVSKGDRLPGAPWTVTFSGEYTLPLIKDRQPYIHMDYHYATAQTALLPTQDPKNGISDPTIPGLPLVRSLAMRAGMRWNGMDVSLYGQNLTNEHPLLFESRDTTAEDLYFARSTRPRTIGLTATYRY
jgi:iron complex outermembrane recepter protein